ncbi:diguanylate cyclase, partial [Gilvimarinus agarilyticus]
MNPNDTIRLLILNDSQQEAERLISMLQNAGKPNRAQHVTNADSLAKLLEEQAWDLLIAHEKTQNLAPSDAVQQIRRLNKDVPVLLLSDEEGSQVVVEGLKLGAADVIRLDEDQHLLLVINREMLNRKQRQEKRIADRQFRESERRAQSLLDSSRDAIAYVQDGLYLYANESFAELFAYEDKDDIDCMPIMDMVAERDQKNLKDFIKQFTLKGAGAESSQLKFQGIKQDGSITPIALEVSHATYDDEPCLQFLAKATKLDAVSSEEIEAAKSLDVVTGLYNRSYMMSATDKIIDNISDDQNRALLYIDIDDYTESVQGKFGVSGADAAIADLAQLINKVTKKGELLARFGDNSFTLLTGTTTTSEAVKRATKINAAIAEHIIDIKNVTLQVTASIGVSVINENSSKAETAIEQALDAMEKARASDECTAMLYEPPMSDEERQEKNMIADVRHALDNDMFHLMFQPIISLRGSDEEHYEVLVRLKSGSGEQLPPEQFIDAAIDAGIGGKMDRWIILESIKMLSEHRAQGNHTKLIVNLNRVSVCDESLVPWLGVA